MSLYLNLILRENLNYPLEIQCFQGHATVTLVLPSLGNFRSYKIRKIYFLLFQA